MNTRHLTTLLLSTAMIAVMSTTAHAAFSITNQPADASAYTNATVQLTVQTEGSGGVKQPDGVRWYFNASSSTGLIVPGNLLTIAPPYSSVIGSDTAQGTTYWTNILTISPIALANGGYYACVLTNGSTSVTSEVATVTVLGGFPEVVSIQLADPDVGAYVPLDGTDTTGAFPAANWNSLAVDTPAPTSRGTNYTVQAFVLKDRDGAASTVEMTVRGASDAYRHEDPQTNSTPIARLMNTFIKTWWRPVDTNIYENFLGQGRMQLVLSNLDNTETYSVYLYLADKDVTGTDGFQADIDAGSGVTNYTGSLPNTLPSVFVPSMNQNPAGPRDAGNYVRINGISPVGGSITVTVNYWDPSWTGWGAGVCGLQLVRSTLDEVAPSVTVDPVDRTIYTGVTATFSVAVLGVPTPAVQWYEVASGVTNLIPGATSLSYTTPPATLGMSGTAYFAVASNGSGTATSASATLTVLTPAADAGEVFSVQLADPDAGGFEALTATESTGAFPMTNWNAIEVNVPGVGAGWVEQSYPLNDQYGIGSGVELIIRGASDAWRFDDPPLDSSPSTKLMNSFIKTWYRPSQPETNKLGEGRIQLVLTNLNNALTYNLYLYLADNDGFEADVTAEGLVTNFTGTLPTSLPPFFAASTNQSPLGVRDPGNYVRQAGLIPTNGAITVTVDYYDPSWEGFGAGVCGLQLVKESRDLFGPVIDPHPPNLRVLTNTTATVFAGVLGSPPATSFQWYEVVGGVTNLIPGATNQTYTTPPVTDATSGRGYVLVASSGLGSVTSGIGFVTGAHLVGPVPGLLQVDQYYTNDLAPLDEIFLDELLTPGFVAANTPDRVFWINTLQLFSPELPDSSGELIYGWFTPPVTTNYVFFISADDDALFLMSTDSDPANRCQIAFEEVWSDDGNNWTNSNGGSSLSQKRSDQFVYDSFYPGAQWPGGNTISLTAGVPYYVEVGHVQGDGGQSAAVTYKFEGEPDPADGTPTMMTSDQLSTISAPDYLLPSPTPQIQNVADAGPDITLSGDNGLVNGLYYVVASTNLSMPLDSWTVVETNFFDVSGNFTSTVPRNPSEPVSFYRLLSVQ